MGSVDMLKYGSTGGELTDKQRHFAHEYVIDFNATRAAKAAGYKHPNVMGTKLLKVDGVRRYVMTLEREALKALGVRLERVLREIAYCALRDPADLCDENGYINVDNLRRLPEPVRRSINGIKVRQQYDADGNVVGQTCELKLVPKETGLEMLMRHFGAFAPNKHELTMGSPAVDWDKLLGGPEEPVPDLIEGEIVESGGQSP